MIRDDHVKRAIVERAPKFFSVRALADWRAAFKLGRAVWHILGREREIMRTRLSRERQAFLFCRAD